MGLLYNLFLLIVSAFHILLCIGYHFKVTLCIHKNILQQYLYPSRYHPTTHLP